MSRRFPIGAVCVVKRGSEDAWARQTSVPCPVRDGQIVRIAGHVEGNSSCADKRGYLLDGISASPFLGFAHPRLSRVTKAKPDFVASLRAMRPRKAEELA